MLNIIYAQRIPQGSPQCDVDSATAGGRGIVDSALFRFLSLLQPPQAECRDARPAQTEARLRQALEFTSRAGRSEYAQVPWDCFQLLQVLMAPQ